MNIHLITKELPLIIMKLSFNNPVLQIKFNNIIDD